MTDVVSPDGANRRAAEQLLAAVPRDDRVGDTVDAAIEELAQIGPAGDDAEVEEIAVLVFPVPDAGDAIHGEITVQTVSQGAVADRFIRLVWQTKTGLTVMDWPVGKGAEPNIALQVGAAIVQRAQQARETGFIVP